MNEKLNEMFYIEPSMKFPDEIVQLQASGATSTSSQLATLAPEYDANTQLIFVNGRHQKFKHLR